jgi:vacuolar-type H+-ATPase subunit F/Vma7
VSVQRIAAIGERARLYGLAFVGVHIVAADDQAAVRVAWQALPDDVGLVILTRESRTALAVSEQDERLWVVMPE